MADQPNNQTPPARPASTSRVTETKAQIPTRPVGRDIIEKRGGQTAPRMTAPPPVSQVLPQAAPVSQQPAQLAAQPAQSTAPSAQTQQSSQTSGGNQP
jgi:hypothetical protein